ncbi:Os02g0600050, partial [Oryza sativa Japonica Group]
NCCSFCCGQILLTCCDQLISLCRRVQKRVSSVRSLFSLACHRATTRPSSWFCSSPAPSLLFRRSTPTLTLTATLTMMSTPPAATMPPRPTTTTPPTRLIPLPMPGLTTATPATRSRSTPLPLPSAAAVPLPWLLTRALAILLMAH